MRKILLSILLTIVATGANAQFKGSVDIMYKMEPRTHVISFNFARVCQQLGVDKDEFGLLLRRQWYGNNNAKRDYGLYLLTDGGGETDFYYILTPDGKKAGSPSEGLWRCEMTCEFITSNRFDFFVCPRTDGSDDEYPLGKVGDSYNAVFALEYQGRIATFDITLNLAEEEGPAIPLSSLEKVGEKVLSGCIDYSVGNEIEFDLTGVASLFGDDVESGNLQIYGLKDAEQQLISGDDTGLCITIDGMRCMSWDWRTTNFYGVGYNRHGKETLTVGADPSLFPGGQKTSGSVFLVADGKYYELILDVQFGDEYADQQNFDIVKTEQLDVQLMWTENYFSYRNREDGRFGLISTDIDEAEVKKLIGTNSPRLYAEQKDGNAIAYTSRYNAAPGQGFWFTSDGGQCYRQNSNYRSIGAYYTEGSLKWYESPSLELDDRFQVNLYLANPENGKAVKYEIGIELVKELQTESVAYVRKLPIGMDDTNGIHSAPMPQPTSSALYDLSGRRLQQKPAKGIYIEGGKTILVK
jgi:hypothetical protein